MNDALLYQWINASFSFSELNYTGPIQQSPQWCKLHGKPLLFPTNFTWLTYLPWFKVMLPLGWWNVYLVPIIEWEPCIQSLQTLVALYPCHDLDLIKFWRNFVGTSFIEFNFLNFGYVLLQSNILLGIFYQWLVRLIFKKSCISIMGGLIDGKLHRLL